MTTGTRSSSLGTSSTTDLYDADGHVIEDVPGIIEKLPKKYAEPRRRQMEHVMSKLHGMTIFPPLGYLSSFPGGGGEESPMSRRGPMENGENPASWEYFLDAIGIQRTVLYPTLGLTVGRVRDLEYSVAVTRAWNDWIAETYIQHPSGKFQAAALLPMQVPSEAAAELRRVVTELGFAAAVIPSHGLPTHLGSDMYFPVYEVAQELDVGLACHGGIHDGFGYDDFNVFGGVHALGFPFGNLISLGGMLFNRVFDLFPGLRVAYLEGGVAWTLMAAERFSESFGASTPVASERILKLKPGTSVADYIRDLMQSGRMVIGIEGGEQELARAIEFFDCAAFMYSSDFPHEVNIESCKHELEELEELPIKDEDKALLRGGTARKFYKY